MSLCVWLVFTTVICTETRMALDETTPRSLGMAGRGVRRLPGVSSVPSADTAVGRRAAEPQDFTQTNIEREISLRLEQEKQRWRAEESERLSQAKEQWLSDERQTKEAWKIAIRAEENEKIVQFQKGVEERYRQRGVERRDWEHGEQYRCAEENRYADYGVSGGMVGGARIAESTPTQTDRSRLPSFTPATGETSCSAGKANQPRLEQQADKF